MAAGQRTACVGGPAPNTPAPVDPGGRDRAEFHIAGMTCASDAVQVERRLRSAPGILDIVVSPMTEIAYVDYDPSRIDPDGIQHALDATGYGPAARWRES